MLVSPTIIPLVQSHHHHYVTPPHYSGSPYLGSDAGSYFGGDVGLYRSASGSAAGLVVLADTRPPALVELAGQEWTLWAVDATALQV